MKKLTLLFCFMLCMDDGIAQHIEKANYVVLRYKPTKHYWIGIPKKSVQSTLSEKEIREVESLLYKCIKEFNSSQQKAFNECLAKDPNCRRWHYFIDISRYKAQFISAITPNGEKVVWVNFLCDTGGGESWKKEIPTVCDGGLCYFSLKVNLNRKLYYDLHINGLA